MGSLQLISGGESSPPTEDQVKALFLFSFAKYVDWPSNAFSHADAPIVIGIEGEDLVAENLKQIIEGKKVAGRLLAFKRVTCLRDAQACHVLFISDTEEGRVLESLQSVLNIPIVTVGETEGFLQEGGIINMIKKDNRIRLEINLNAARQAQVTISSKLLAVADRVIGKVGLGRMGRDILSDDENAFVAVRLLHDVWGGS
jgi:hypothetical protein